MKTAQCTHTDFAYSGTIPNTGRWACSTCGIDYDDVTPTEPAAALTPMEHTLARSALCEAAEHAAIAIADAMHAGDVPTARVFLKRWAGYTAALEPADHQMVNAAYAAAYAKRGRELINS